MVQGSSLLKHAMLVEAIMCLLFACTAIVYLLNGKNVEAFLRVFRKSKDYAYIQVVCHWTGRAPWQTRF